MRVTVPLLRKQAVFERQSEEEEEGTSAQWKASFSPREVEGESMEVNETRRRRKWKRRRRKRRRRRRRKSKRGSGGGGRIGGGRRRRYMQHTKGRRERSC